MATAGAGCKDDPAGPGVSDDTRWRIACARETDRGDCGFDYPSHGGPESAGEIKVSCTKGSGGLRIRLEDPGTESMAERGRNRSIVEITYIDLEDNECAVVATEYDKSAGGGQFQFRDVCSGNANADGKCEITGEMNSGGFDFNGSIYCPALKLRGNGDPDWKLEKGDEPDAPVPLQIVNCS